MSEKKISITVLMPVYNSSRYVLSSVKSILNQTYREFEFLIIDDGSTDDSAEIISSIKDKRINYKYINHSGLASALNYGLKIAAGDYIARIDSDDLNTINRLQVQRDFLLENPDCSVVSSWSVYFKDPSEVLFLLKTPESDSEIKNFLNLHNPINHSSVMFNKKIIQDNGGYDESFKCYEDYELWFRLRDKLNFRTLPEYLVYTRMHKDSMTQNSGTEKIYSMLRDDVLKRYMDNQIELQMKEYKERLFWIEYFYGNRLKCREYFKKNFSIRKAAAMMNTFLSDGAFEKIRTGRLRHRIESFFTDKKLHETELKRLLN